jgi:radical SAM superfamily enzyme YgiQ (UPF0313 family)
VLLVDPPMPYGIKGHLQTPLGLCYLSSTLSPIAESKVFDCNVSDELENLVSVFQPDVIGISILTATFRNSIVLLKILRSLSKKECVFIAGGVHASIFPEDMLNNGFDLVIRGEGEKTFYNVILSIIEKRDYGNICGISYITTSGKIMHNKEAEKISNLDELPFPDRKDLPSHKYEHESILTSRGCNFRCFYCSSSHYWGQRIRYRSAINVFSELSQLYRSGITNFYFCDDNFLSSHKLVRDICERIVNADMRIKWSALTRIDTVDPPLLKLMKQAGCTILSLGIESGLNDFHKKIKKTSVKAIKNTFISIREVGIKIRTTWIIGLGKTLEDEYNSLQLIKELLPDQVSIHCLIPFPNTDAWNDPEKYNIIIDKDNLDWDVMHMAFSPYLLDYIKFRHITKEQIIRLLQTIREELMSFGYDGRTRKLDTFLDNVIIKVIE